MLITEYFAFQCKSCKNIITLYDDAINKHKKVIKEEYDESIYKIRCPVCNKSNIYIC